jgi:coproporphyrinogen III oxidase-like Fe-S oxidoreductase
MCLVDGEGVRATEVGRLFVRNLAMCFDTYLAARQKQSRPVFSRTV